MTETEETVLDLEAVLVRFAKFADGLGSGAIDVQWGGRIDDLPWERSDQIEPDVRAVIAALSRAPEDQELGSSTRMTSPASRSQKPLSAGWQDISSAPTMEAVLVYGGEVKYPVVASWTGLNDEPWTLDALGNVHDEIDWPTHWMPLPEPPAEDGFSGAQRSELTRLAQNEPASPPPSTGGEGEPWDRIPPAKRFGRRLDESAVKHLAPGTLLRFYSEDPWFDPSPSSPANGDIVIFTGAVSNTFPKVGPHLEVRTLGGRVYPGGGWVYQIFQFVADPSPEMGEISRAAVLRMIGDAFQDGGGCVEGHDWSWDVVEFKAVANKLADKLKENGLSREELGGSSGAGSGAAGPSDCAEGDARLSDGGANPSGGSGA